MNDGYIYILKNPSFENLLKIGQTTRSPEERAQEISSATGVPTTYTVEYSFKVPKCEEAETLVHQKLESYRFNKSKEFFDIPIEQAINVIEEVALCLIEGEIRLQQEHHQRLIDEKEEYIEKLIQQKEEISNKHKTVDDKIESDGRILTDADWEEHIKSSSPWGERAERCYVKGIRFYDQRLYETAKECFEKAAELGHLEAKEWLNMKIFKFDKA